jgi:hypothetical protein
MHQVFTRPPGFHLRGLSWFEQVRKVYGLVGRGFVGRGSWDLVGAFLILLVLFESGLTDF